ncbi:hypothetical protein MC885_004668 [Smutsia gigantea]|nr:hypothetical protein MC885_004668 [Smutsia gigantea]
MSCHTFQQGSRSGSRSFSSCSAVLPWMVTHYAVSKGPCRPGGTGGLRALGCLGSRSLCGVGFGRPRVAPRYEEELSLRPCAENEFVALKKDVDTAFLMKADLETNMEALVQETDFLKGLHEEYEELRLTAGNHCDNLRNRKNEILEMNKLIQRLQQETEAVKVQSSCVFFPLTPRLCEGTGPVNISVSSSKGTVLYEPCMVSTPVLRTEYGPGSTSVLQSSAGRSIVGTSELYIPCEPQGLLGCGGGRSSSMRLGTGGGSSHHKC